MANERNIMQALSECLELTHSLDNFTLGNKPPAYNENKRR